MNRRRRPHAEPMRRYHARLVFQAVIGFGAFYAWLVAVTTGLAR